MYLALERVTRPASVEEALRELRSAGPGAAYLGGGSDLNVRGHEELRTLVDLQALPLKKVEATAQEIRIGALVTLAQLRREPLLAQRPFGIVREAAAGYAVVALQNRGTIGGRVMLDRGDQDLPPALLALGARLRLARLEGEKVVETTIDYPVGGQARAALRGALLLEVILPRRPGTSGFRRFGRLAVDAPLATVAVVLRTGEARVAVNAQGPRAGDLRLLGRAAGLLEGWNGSRPADWKDHLREAALAELPSWSDALVSGEYRRDLTATLVVRAAAAAAGEETP